MSCDFWLQSYEKSSAKQRNSFLFFPRPSNFAIFDGRVTKKKSEMQKENKFFFWQSQMARWHVGTFDKLEKCKSLSQKPLEKCQFWTKKALEKCNYLRMSLTHSGITAHSRWELFSPCMSGNTRRFSNDTRYFRSLKRRFWLYSCKHLNTSKNLSNPLYIKAI